MRGGWRVAERPLPPYTMGDLGRSIRRSAPAAARNMAPIEMVLRDWLPASGLVLEVASGTGEHALAFARAFPALDWQPSDSDRDALASIAAWRVDGPPNLHPPLLLDAASEEWPLGRADAILNVNMVHIAPPAAGIGLLDGAARLLPPGAPLILYGPWLETGVEPAPSNLLFDTSLKARNRNWGLRTVETFADAAAARGLMLEERRAMPSNNLMLRFAKR